VKRKREERKKGEKGNYPLSEGEEKENSKEWGGGGEEKK